MTVLPHRKAICLLAAACLACLLMSASGNPKSEPESTPVTIISCEMPPVFYLPDIPLSRTLQRHTYDLCQSEQLDYELALAMMWTESRFQSDAVHFNSNGTKDSGLMQINDINSEWMRLEYGVTDFMDEEQNIRAGVMLLAQFVRKYGEHDGLMAYNLGESGMKKAKERGVVTTVTVQRLLQKRDAFESLPKYY